MQLKHHSRSNIKKKNDDKRKQIVCRNSTVHVFHSYVELDFKKMNTGIAFQIQMNWTANEKRKPEAKLRSSNWCSRWNNKIVRAVLWQLSLGFDTFWAQLIRYHSVKWIQLNCLILLKISNARASKSAIRLWLTAMKQSKRNKRFSSGTHTHTHLAIRFEQRHMIPV